MRIKIGGTERFRLFCTNYVRILKFFFQFPLAYFLLKTSMLQCGREEMDAPQGEMKRRTPL